MTCGTLGFDVVSSFFTVPVAVLLGGRIDTELTSVHVQSASMGRTQDAAAASTIGIDAEAQLRMVSLGRRLPCHEN